MTRPSDDLNRDQSARDSRRKFLKKAGTIVVAAPVMESLSREGLIVRSAHAQTVAFGGLGGPMAGPILDPL
jgi:hypothetical protein